MYTLSQKWKVFFLIVSIALSFIDLHQSLFSLVANVGIRLIQPITVIPCFDITLVGEMSSKYHIYLYNKCVTLETSVNSSNQHS